MQHDTVERPAFMSSSHFLSHRRQKSYNPPTNHVDRHSLTGFILLLVAVQSNQTAVRVS